MEAHHHSHPALLSLAQRGALSHSQTSLLPSPVRNPVPHAITIRDNPPEPLLPQLSPGKRHWTTTQVGKIGRRPKPKNQDAYFYREFVRPVLQVVGVCDGHGEHGHYVSSFVAQQLPQIVRDLSCKYGGRSNWPKALHEGFLHCCALLKQQNFDTACSGTTCIFLAIHQGYIHCANVGDSRAVLGTTTETGVIATDLSHDHKPDKPEEKRRLLKFRARIGSDVTPHGHPDGPLRVWVEGGTFPGLAMTRVLGDWPASQAGVISAPEVVSRALSLEDKFVVAATDGVWEMVSSGEAVVIVGQALAKGRSGSKALVDLAVRRWQEREESMDDVTAVVVELKP